MKKLLFFLTVFLILILTTVLGFTQDKVVHGQVFTFDSIPVVNAVIKIKSSKQEVKSDTNGRFTAECTSDDVLTVSANGFNSEKVKLTEKSGNINVNLKLKPGDKNLKAAINNGHVSNAENFTAIAKTHNGDEDFSQYGNIYEIIQDKFPGVQIINGELIIRGFNRIQSNAAGQGALIVVDGSIGDKSILNTVPTSLVKSIKIMKDGSNAIYGSRGTNGVVLIKTKRVGED